MKYINLWVILAVVCSSSVASAGDYTTGCSYRIKGDRKSYKLRTLEDQTILTFTSEQDISPQKCVSDAITALKKKYPSKYLAGGQLRDSSYFNKTATVQVIHKDNVDFPKQRLELSIVQDPQLSLQNGFVFKESWFSDNYYEARIGSNK
ncbi:MAG: hypothetical protein R2877_00890 [Bdellovibrionota bacterium]